MSADERMDHMNVLLMAVKTRLRKVEAQLAALLAKKKKKKSKSYEHDSDYKKESSPSESSGTDSDCCTSSDSNAESESPVGKKRKVPPPESSDSESSNEPLERKLPRRKRRKRVSDSESGDNPKSPIKKRSKKRVNYNEDSDSDIDFNASNIGEEKEVKRRSKRLDNDNEGSDSDIEIDKITFPVGSIFSTVDGYCVFLGGDQFGWLYRQKDMPKKQQAKVNSGDLVVSDYDYFDLDYNDKTVKRLVGDECDKVYDRIRKDFLFMADSERLVRLPVIEDEAAIAPALASMDCQVHFGLPSQNKSNSDELVSGLSRCNTTFTKLPHAYNGKCTACNMCPKWISYQVDVDGTTKQVGETCKSRIKILDALYVAWHSRMYHVYLFRFLETM